MGYILGIDEAGRGAWAGPLVVGAVMLGDYLPKGLADSKLLSRTAREKLAELIYANCIQAGLGWVSSEEIDAIGLTKATLLGIERAIKGLQYEETEIIIDGNINYLASHENTRCVIKADQTVPPVSAAGIIAKVARDEYMRNTALKFPGFGFENHVGYGTKLHSESLKKYGKCEEHRMTFKPISAFS